jgi:hypothetical protein
MWRVFITRLPWKSALLSHTGRIDDAGQGRSSFNTPSVCPLQLPLISISLILRLFYLQKTMSLRQIYPGPGEDLGGLTTIEYEDEILFPNHGR